MESPSTSSLTIQQQPRSEDDGDETVLLLKDGFDAARLDAATKTVAAAKARLAK